MHTYMCTKYTCIYMYVLKGRTRMRSWTNCLIFLTLFSFRKSNAKDLKVKAKNQIWKQTRTWIHSQSRRKRYFFSKYEQQSSPLLNRHKTSHVVQTKFMDGIAMYGLMIREEYNQDYCWFSANSMGVRSLCTNKHYWFFHYHGISWNGSACSKHSSSMHPIHVYRVAMTHRIP